MGTSGEGELRPEAVDELLAALEATGRAGALSTAALGALLDLTEAWSADGRWDRSWRALATVERSAVGAAGDGDLARRIALLRGSLYHGRGDV
jgi:hypothetical protein